MKLADYVSFICPIVGQTDAVSQGICKTFVQRRYQMIYDMRNWKDATDLVTGLNVGLSGVMDYPAGIDRVITVRGNGNHLIMPSDAAQVMEIDPTLFERTGDPQVWFDYVVFVEGTPPGPTSVAVHRMKFLPTPTVATPIMLQGTRDFTQLIADTDEPVLRGIDEALIAYALGDMLRRQRQYGKAQLIYQEASAALKNMVESETEASAFNARIVPWPEDYGMEGDYSFMDRFLTVNAPPPPGDTESGTMNLVNGQSYIDVAFLTQKTVPTWVFTALTVINTVDSNPLNIFGTFVSNKTANGFRLQLDAAPNSSNYYLQWAVTT